ncbi:MAG: ShlB/FhaC/HecB family hemolysin secretion/activation protein [Sedimenticola sp.]
MTSDSNKTLVLLSMGFFVPQMCLAATAPDVGQQFEQHKQQELQQRLPKPSVPVIEKELEAKPSVGEATVFVRAFRLEGTVTVFDEQRLLEELDEVTNRDLTISQLRNAAARLTRLYRQAGYLLARAILPPQDVTEGVITLRIVEGELDSADGGVTISDPESSMRLDPQRALRIVKRAVPAGKPIKKADLERGVLLVSDLPGIGATANLSPGAEPGTTHVTVDVIEGPLFAPQVGLDNAGSRLTGRWQLNAAVDVNDISGIGNQFTAYATHSFGSGGSDYLSLSYNQPIGYSGFKLGLDYRQLKYTVGKEFKSADMDGSAESWLLHGSYPVVRTSKTSLFLHGGVEWKDLQDSAAGIKTTDQDIRIATFGGFGSHLDNLGGGGITEGGVSLHLGDLDLSGLPSALAADQALTGAHTHGDFQKLRFNLSRIQRATKDIFFVAALRGQYAADNLATAEKFQLGGPTGVRAYPVGEGRGDDGVLLKLEGNYLAKSGTPFGDLRLVGFIDWGWVRQYHDPGNLSFQGPNSYNLKGWGLGLSAGKPGESDFSLTWARRIGSNPNADPVTGNDSDGSHDKQRVWASLRLQF